MAEGIRPPLRRHKVTSLNARLAEAAVRTRAILWEANDSVRCALCGALIPKGDLFTRAFYEGGGRRHGDLCRACRPFEVEQPERAR